MFFAFTSLVADSSIDPVDDKNFWYIACESSNLNRIKPVAARLFEEWIVLYRDESGRPIALQDRCIHRSSQLSRGTVKNGCLKCPYHGWTYNGQGDVVDIPAESSEHFLKKKQGLRYATFEQDGYVYVNLNPKENAPTKPFDIPFLNHKGYAHIRLKNFFKNNVTNCVENFIDVPHTIFVHPTIFRKEKNQKQRLKADVKRHNGSVIVNYQLETDNFGVFSWFLNPKGEEIIHRDSFHMPNITHVEYIFGTKKHFNITSQSIPLGPAETLVYTDLTFNYGIWNWLSKPLIRWQAQKIIDQDVSVLNNQWLTIQKYGDTFINSNVDIIHVFIESIRGELQKQKDPRQLAPRDSEVEFWI